MVNIDKIKTLAKLRGLKLGKLCEELGEDQNYFNKVKLGLRRMDENRILYLAERLGTTYDYLADVTDDPSIHRKTNRKDPVFSWDRFFGRIRATGKLVGYVETKLRMEPGSLEYAANTDRIPGDQLISEMAVVCETTPEYLTGLTDDPSFPLDDKTGIKIGVFGDVAAGIPIDRIENFDPEDPDSWEEIDRWTAKGGTYFALRIKGDSMEPRIRDGDRVIVRMQETIESGQTAVVAINGDTATCKKITYDEQGGMFLLSNNPNYPPRYFTADQIQKLPVRILGRVVEIRGLP